MPTSHLQHLALAHLAQAAALTALYPHPAWQLPQLTSSLHAGHRIVGAYTPPEADKTDTHTYTYTPQNLAAYYVALPGADAAELLHICTHPTQLRQGLAKALLQDLQVWAQQQGKTAIWLEVRVSNHPAIALYEHHGFQKVGLRPNYYSSQNPGQSEAALQMSLML